MNVVVEVTWRAVTKDGVGARDGGSIGDAARRAAVEKEGVGARRFGEWDGGCEFCGEGVAPKRMLGTLRAI